ncbi:MAG: hypothetical protein ACRDXB_06910, partial [Actinomycetes bacterium]
STTVVHPDGQGSLQVTPDGTSVNGGGGSDLTGAGTVTAAEEYYAMLWANVPGGGVSLTVLVNWHDSGGSFLSSSLGTFVTPDAGEWTHVQETVTAPGSASQATVWAWHTGTPDAAEVWYAWAVRLVPANATSPQDFTVVRAGNGVVKAHPAGEQVSLYRPTIRAL